MPRRRNRKSGPIPLAVRLAAADDSDDDEPWHQNLTPSSSRSSQALTPSSSRSSQALPPSLSRSSQALPPSSSRSSQALLPSSSRSSQALLPSSSRSSQALLPSSSRSSQALPPSSSRSSQALLPSSSRSSQALPPSSSRSSQALPPSSSQSSQAKGPSSEELNQLAGSIIRYLLSADRSKNVIQRPHLLKTAFGNYGKYYRLVMPIVKNKLSEIFGLRLIEFESGKYIIVNAIPNDLPHLRVPEEEKPCRTLLILVLTHIFMLDGKCSEDFLWIFLRYLKIIKEDDFNSIYVGDVQKVVCTDFVKQQYLSRSMIGSTEPAKYELEWGLRAKLEVSKRHMLVFVSKMFEDRSLKSWPNQYKSMLADEHTAD